ncbi:hypothetical protein LRS13_09350 [Svornostia abyssi]|uniref:Uncharacterized protein n=1 Tax=Svornostia abyssi TaxID=2898438 RepID=A0ABY5PM34_9ACTN|nr:hypothetical protein LRS13_09350 [Parviterribacteraceae bacterium J379]
MTARRLLLALLTIVVAAVPGSAPAHGAYGFIQEWGSPGTGAGQFTDLRDVATDANGNVFTAEAGRLQKFGPSRTFLLERSGEPGGNFTSLAVHGAGATGVVYTVDRTRGVLRYRASDLAPLGALPLGSVPADWAAPRAVTVDHLGDVIVAFPNDTAVPGKISGVGMWNASGGFIRTIGSYATADVVGTPDHEKYTTPLDVDDDQQPGGKVWVVDAGKEAVFSFSRTTGIYEGRSESSSPAWQPRAVAVMPLDPLLNQLFVPRTVFVADHTTPPSTVSGRLFVWRDSGPFHARFGERGTGPGQFGLISGLEIDAVQRMFAADGTNAKVLEYGNGGTPGPGDPQDPPPTPPVSGVSSAPPPPSSDPLASSPTPLVCIGLWSASTCGWLPKPQPLQVCVSYWENCNGFMGMKPAKPGTIDLSGFPSTITVDVECGSGPKKGKKRATAVAAQTPSYLKPETECLLEQYVNGDVPDEALQRKKIELLWNIDARAFKAEVAAAYAVTVSGLRAAADPLMGDDVNAWGVKLFFFLSDYIDAQYDELAKIGRPFTVPQAMVSPQRACPSGLTPQDAQSCAELVTALGATIKGSLTLLNRRKLDLFLDMPFEQYYAKLEKEMKKKLDELEGLKEPGGKTRSAAASRLASRKQFVLARAQARLTVGKRGKVRLTFSKETRAHLRALRRAGVRRFDARVLVRSGSTPANQVTRTQKVTISLVKVKKSRGR